MSGVSTAGIAAIYPLTPMQEWMLFHSLLTPGSGTYVQQQVIELEGRLRPDLLRRAFAAMLARHDALRTGFAWQDRSRPLQIVFGQTELHWQELGPPGSGPGPGAEEDPPLTLLESWLAHSRTHGFDLSRPPLIRFALLPLAPDRHLLAISHHHAILDGWGLLTLIREAVQVYEAVEAGRPDPLAPARQFGDYVAWLRRTDAWADEDFWRRTLRGFTVPTRVADAPPAASEPRAARSLRAPLPEPDAVAVRELCRRHGLSVGTLCQAAWALVLSRSAGVDDVVFGMMVSGRPADLDGVESIVGMFVNTLPLRVSVPATRPVSEWLGEVQASFARSREHEHVSLQQVQRWSELGRGTPIFESVLAVQNLITGPEEMRAAGLTIRAHSHDEWTGLPLTVLAYPRSGGLLAGVDVDPERVRGRAARRLLDEYLFALAALARNAGSTVASVPAAPPEALASPGAAAAAGDEPDLLRRLAHVPADRRQRFLERLAAETDGPEPHRATGYGPLSVQQEQMWVLDRLSPGAAVNNVPVRLRVRGGIEERALLRAVREVVTRHEVLLARVSEVDGRPAQVGTWDGPEPRTFDLRPLTEDARGAELERLTAETARRPFDLDHEPPLRLTVIRLGAADAVVLIVAHHLVMDAASASILAADLLAACREEGAGGRAPQAGHLTYADYARRQRERLSSGGKELVAFWRAELDGWQRLSLPTDRRRSREAARAGGRAELVLDAAHLAGLSRLPAPPGAGLYPVLLAVFAAFLHRLTGQEDLVVGAGVNLREGPEAGVVGDFGNLLVLRLDLSGRPPLPQLLTRVTETWRRALAHRELPFSQLVEALRPARGDGRLPFFDVFFHFEPEVRDRFTADGLTVDVDVVDDEGIQYDLGFFLARDGDRLSVSVRFDRGLFGDETARRLLACLDSALRSAAETPEATIDRLRVLPAALEREVLAWADGGVAPVQPATLGELFEAQARRTPEAEALTFGDERLSYGDLNRRADRLASRLRSLGAVPEVRIGICLQRSVEMIVAVLAVIKAGAAYVPLDPAYPDGRVRFMVADSGAAIVVTNRTLAPRLDGLAVQLVLAEEIPDGEAAGAGPAVRPGSLAYLLYTSGSTGPPKAVMIEHAAVVDFVAQIARAYGIDAGSRMLGMAPLSFDVSVFEIFAALLNGASLHLAGDDERLSPHRLERLMTKHRVTVAELPPALMPLLAPDRLWDLALVSVGGEAPAGGLVERWHTERRRFVNGYGPTETTVAVTLMDCSGSWDVPPPIGRPMVNHRAYVLDRHLRPVPPGAAGELCIGGAGLARGYHGRPGLTAERFVPDPFSGIEGARLYRTGDGARWLSDGTLEFLGRLDSQVKLRGQRVELGEIEHALARQPGVRQALVSVHRQPDGVPTLVAYLVGDWTPDLAEVRAALASDLPAHMLPGRVVHLDRVPLTPQGKIDRRALPAPEAPDAASRIVSPPTGPVEERIAGEILAPLLSLDEVDATANFFELGGDSLLAIQLISRVRTAFGVEVSLADFLEEGTVRRLAVLVESAMAVSSTEESELQAILDSVEALSEAEAEDLLQRHGPGPL